MPFDSISHFSEFTLRKQRWTVRFVHQQKAKKQNQTITTTIPKQNNSQKYPIQKSVIFNNKLQGTI